MRDDHHGHGHHDHAHEPHHHDANGHHHPHPPGHNRPAGKPLQWQTPHLPHDHAHEPADPGAVDLDLVEQAFVEGFVRAPDVSSFLRLARVPFVGEAEDGRRLHLLRVETEDMVDVGAVMPLIGRAAVNYHPLPSRLTSRRRRLSFIYHDGREIRRLGFADARSLQDKTEPSQFALGEDQ